MVLQHAFRCIVKLVNLRIKEETIPVPGNGSFLQTLSHVAVSFFIKQADRHSVTI
jgi:hypothetical protein